ncbi:hypothetical protein BB558_004213 [Smittium angustum]|uniref:Uncharacterized protein n=1 Tax=Smittium angustum TaxID=133377 RepID=A0A2U1IYB0_SMIAN|nr:hypothetical protein BB558_006233 [Smittium angustum]PVZ98815.1 hypothetical protein BB558_005176 [Smittium angustum]PVZ99752.1 hypothetical protein BB558_004213 [Smittium angustum]
MLPRAAKTGSQTDIQSAINSALVMIQNKGISINQDSSKGRSLFVDNIKIMTDASNEGGIRRCGHLYKPVYSTIRA